VIPHQIFQLVTPTHQSPADGTRGALEDRSASYALSPSCPEPGVRGELMRARLSRQVFGAVLLALLRPAGEAAASSAGVVTGVSGQVTVSRTEASPLPLRFKDEVFLKDRIS